MTKPANDGPHTLISPPTIPRFTMRAPDAQNVGAGGGSGSGGDMEQRVARLEDGHVRILSRLDVIDNRLDNIDKRLDFMPDQKDFGDFRERFTGALGEFKASFEKALGDHKESMAKELGDVKDRLGRLEAQSKFTMAMMLIMLGILIKEFYFK